MIYYLELINWFFFSLRMMWGFTWTHGFIVECVVVILGSMESREFECPGISDSIEGVQSFMDPRDSS